MAQLGMDADAVEAAGRQLQAKAQSLDTVVANLDKTVASLNGVWDGKDAQTFINEWWPEHKKALAAASTSVAGLGQSALNNASEQRQASGVSGAGALGLAAAAGGAAIAAVVSGGAQMPTVAASSTATAEQTAMQSWAAGSVGKFLDVDPRYGVQCVGAVNNYADTLFPGVSHYKTLGGGNAIDIYGNANPTYFDKIPSGGTPQPGDIVCIGSTTANGGYGHVAVVESVDSSGIHVIEQNGNAPDQPAYRAVLGSSDSAAVQGYLRPKVS